MPFDRDMRALLKAVKASSVTPADAIGRVRRKLAEAKGIPPISDEPLDRELPIRTDPDPAADIRRAAGSRAADQDRSRSGGAETVD